MTQFARLVDRTADFPAGPAHAARGDAGPPAIPAIEAGHALDYALLGAVSLLLHSVIWLLLQQPVSDAKPPIAVQMLEISLVAPPPPVVALPPVVLPPPPEPEPEPELVEAPPVPEPAPLPKPTPKPVAKPKPRPVTPAPPVVAVPQPPVQAAPSLPIAAVPVDEPVTKAHTHADYLRNPKPVYPVVARRRGWEGKVLLKVHVLESGKPTAVDVEKASGRTVLDQSAVKAVQGWTFVPAMRGSTPIASWVTISIVFKLEN